MRVLFVFPNIDCGGYKPPGLTAVMNSTRREGHEVKLFDTSFVDTKDIIQNKNYKGINAAGEEILNLKPVDLKPYGIFQEKINIEDELRKVLEDFKPDIAAFSVLSLEWRLSVFLMRCIKAHESSILTVVGGVHAYADPEGAIKEDSLDAICIGEGEYVFVHLLNKLAEKKDYENTPGFWIKRNGKLFKNSIGQVVHDVDSLPYFEYDLYDERLFYRAYDGKVYRSGDHVLSRGCPGKCTYCLFDKMRSLNQKNAKMRRYSIGRFIEELAYLKSKYKLNFYRFQDATFLVMKNEYLQELSIEYARKIDLPFVVDASPESITSEKVKALSRMGCISISIGVEVGDEKRRFELCNKRVKNETIINAFKIANSYGLRTVAFLMLGFPMETRDAYWATVKLVREAEVRSPAIGFVYPFKGSKIREMAIRMKLLTEDFEKNGGGYARGVPVIYNPSISVEEYKGLLRTFYLYVKFPERFWPEIEKAEKFDVVGNSVYRKFSDLYINEQLYNKTHQETDDIYF